MATRRSAVRRAWPSFSIAQGPARSAKGHPPPILTAPTATVRVSASAPVSRSAADEVVVEADLSGAIEPVAGRLQADLGVLSPELGAHPLRGRLVQFGELLDDALDAQPLRPRRTSLAHLV